jgi:catechol 2,3-dioxygenase-like lactoylglutathione lyase family enzyme
MTLTTVVVSDYDPAIRFFVDALGFDLVEDSPALTNDGRPKRWVPAGVAFFFRADDFDATYDRLAGAGVEFVSAPRTEPYGRVAVFRDIAGNKWDLLGPA